MTKIRSKAIIKNMKRGQVATFPIAALETVRNNVSLMNAKCYIEGKKWESKSSKEEGLVRVTRIQ